MLYFPEPRILRVPPSFALRGDPGRHGFRHAWPVAEETTMVLVDFVGLGVALLIMSYLFYALIFPERF
jgi:K+-transporting ATPase KdpF subunit